MSTAHVLLTVVGTLCEVVGLTWIVVEASRARAAEFGERGLFRRTYDWFAYWLGPPSKVVNMSATVSGGGAIATGHAVVVRANETEVERLSRELAELRGRVERREQATSERFAALSERINRVESEMREHVAHAFATTTVLTRTARGDLPTQLSTTSVGYDATETAATSLTGLQAEVDQLKTALTGVTTDVDNLKGKV